MTHHALAAVNMSSNSTIIMPGRVVASRS